MTTVRTPSAAAGTVAVGGGRTPPAARDLVVLPDPPVERADAVAEAVLAEQPVTDDATVDVREALPGDRLRRLEQRRRLVREEMLAVMFLVVMLAVTVGVLAMQWLGSGGPAS